MNFDESRHPLPLSHRFDFRAATRTLCALVALVCAGLPAHAQATSARPQLFPNSRKYRDTGQQPATGRSGTATLAARALYGKDGATEIQLKTSSFDVQDTPPGTISKAQLSPLDNTGQRAGTRNYDNLNGGGYFSTVLNELHLGQQVQAQANIRGIDGQRTDVVTVVGNVLLRPDLRVSDLAAPSTAFVRASVLISAVVSEINGETGAWANANLYVDGAKVDQAKGIWVDAAGTVSVAFFYRFPTAGTHQLEVRAEDVNPGDWDAANNSVSGSISLTESNDTLNYSASVFEREFSSSSKRFDSARSLLTNAGEEESSAVSSGGWQQQAVFQSRTARYALFPFNVSVAEKNDGGTNLVSTYNNVTADSVFGTSRFAIRRDPATGTVVIIQTAEGFLTVLNYQRFAGDTTFQSERLTRVYGTNSDGTTFDNTYFFNFSSRNTSGVRLPLGAQYGFDATLSSADGQSFSASPRFAIGATNSSLFNPYRCFEQTQQNMQYKSCFGSDFSEVRKSGTLSFDGAP